ncbi:orotate phosphoribosyltransferase [Limoniibacter endophyticus]|uniref:Orotate phosphoribosyltransferase n=1 Tax=Limoniibacter endophyticus TaxID=1565040 RepID=A0A8J3DQS6_9HYPH|nr:orotate phosphoribosyltransferase [Limoniibacter endophyticus]GHC81282.1 orotate phosphoribosyltransferase [Limoniibacter endophyticus]
MPSFARPADKEAIAYEAAKMFLEIGAVHFYKDNKPFIFTSGWASPVYTDTRKIISYPRLRSVLNDFAAQTIMTEIGYEQINTVAGGETAGIPFAAWIADRMMLPMQYVRKKPKGFGRNAQIEGLVEDGQKTLLVEDLATDGGSKITFVKALRDAGAEVKHCFVFFYYDIFPHSQKMFDDMGVELHYLTTWRHVLQVAKESGHFEPAVLAEVESFLNAPSEWSARNGGISEFGTKN